MKIIARGIALSTVALLAACASTPMGPTAQVLPGRGKSYEAFQGDQAFCESQATNSVRGQSENANTTGLLYGLGATVLGAGLGAAVGGGYGAGIGAAGGAVAGGALGGSTSGNAQYGIQRRYDNNYVACMVAHGNVMPQASPVLVQPSPYVVQPAPYVVQPQPYYEQQPGY